MGKVVEIGISKNKGNKIISVPMVEAVKGRGLINDRNYNQNTDIKKQITLIEIENIKYYNGIIKENIPALYFRRNIITEGIKLNEYMYKEFFIGNVKVKAHDLCRPCKYLQNMLNQTNLIKELILKAGLRCEILNNGKIFVNDKITV